MLFLQGQSIGLDEQPQIVKDLLPFFKTIPASMFTAFRCFTGECTDHDGRTIHSILAEEFGPVFIFSYVASYMLVSLGIFNVCLGCRLCGVPGSGPYLLRFRWEGFGERV